MWNVSLDPAADLPEAAASGRTELALNSGAIGVDQDGIDWGDGAISAYMADQIVGSSPIDYRIPNRTVTIPLFLGADASGQPGYQAAKTALQQKVGLIQREGGWLKRSDGLVNTYADVVNATLRIPDHYGEAAGVEPGVTLQLECLPDLYGDAITLDTLTGTGAIYGRLKLAGSNAVVLGDMPGRVTVSLSTSGSYAQGDVLWCFRGPRGYDPTNAPLQRDAGATNVTGSYNGKAAQFAAPLNTWATTGPALNMYHHGAYRVLARVQSANGATTKFRLAWGLNPLGGSAQQYNPVVSPPTASPAWHIVDLGIVQLARPPLSYAAPWYLSIAALDTSGACTVAVDQVWFQALDESAGRANDPTTNAALPVIYNGSQVTRFATTGVGVAWGASATYVPGFAVSGDLPRVPVSGYEGGAVELMVKPMRGVLVPNTVSSPLADVADAFTAVVTYRPCYLFSA